MKYVIVAPVGGNEKALYAGIREFPVKKLILITPRYVVADAKELMKKLREFTIESEIVETQDNTIEEMFEAFGKVGSSYSSDELIVNVSAGNTVSTCTALSAAFANGLKAFEVIGDQPVLLPIMNLSYYRELSDNKLRILSELHHIDYMSLGELSERLGVSVPLLSYHINGNSKYKGLKELRLVEVAEENQNVVVRLSQVGSLLSKGFTGRKWAI